MILTRLSVSFDSRKFLRVFFVECIVVSSIQETQIDEAVDEFGLNAEFEGNRTACCGVSGKRLSARFDLVNVSFIIRKKNAD